ncbi:MAG: MFS transporter [Sulfolobaceae archaeon]
MSFLAVVVGVPSYLLGIVTSSTTAFTNLSSFIFSLFKIEPKRLMLFSNFGISITLLLFSFLVLNPIYFTLLYVIISALLGASSFSWYLFAEELTRGVKRGSKLADLSFYSTLGSSIATVIVGFFLDKELSVISIVFIICSIITLVSTIIIYFSTLTYHEHQNLLNKYNRINKFYIENFIFMITWSFAWPLFPIVQVKILSMSSAQIALTSIISTLSTLAFQKVIGKLVDKNIKLSMFLGRILLATFPLTYALATNVYQIYLINIVSGFTNAISNVAFFAFVVEESKEKRRGIGLYNLVNGFGSLIGSVIGSITFSVVSQFQGLDAAKTLLMVATIMRILASIPFLFI